MCGIAGELNFEAGRSGADWALISDLMARRGPDDDGLWHSGNGKCTLVFRRLSILDLSESGHQPMISYDGRYALVFNGEVYNFRELRRHLEAQGRRFRSTGDAEVVMWALAEWGKGALEKFNGMFALAFYDNVERRLLIARDHAGIKPLYYLRAADGIFFASQYDQILNHPWARNLPVSREAFSMYLRLAYVPAPYGILAETHMLEPGYWLEISDERRIRAGRYYEFPQYETPIFSGKEAMEAVNEAIDASVKRQLVSDVQVASFLSGGIDSPLITAKMQREMREPINAYTIGTEDKETDESEAAARYARALGVNHIIHRVTAEQSLNMLEDVVSACGEPLGDYSIFPTMLVSRLARRDVKVALSGDGGDELFWGYAKRSIGLIRGSEAFKGPRWWRMGRWGLKKSLGIGGGTYAARRYASIGEWQRATHTHLPENRLTHIFPTFPAWPERDMSYEYTGWERDRTAQWLRRNEFTSHLPMVLLKVDRASMYHSLEVRVPLLDREVIEVAAQVDWRSCLDMENSLGKLPLRASLSRHLDYQTTKKRGFGVPVGDWLRGPLRPAVEEYLLQRDDILGLEIDRKALHDLFNEHFSGRRDYGWGLWPLLSLALWERHHLLGRRGAGRPAF